MQISPPTSARCLSAREPVAPHFHRKVVVRCQPPVTSAALLDKRVTLQSASDRRGVLLGGGLALLGLVDAPSADAFGSWDGRSAALGSCPLGEEGDECRKQTILRDASKAESYSDASKKGGAQIAANSAGLPVAEMSDAYTKETLLLSSEIEKYASLDPFDPERPKVVQLLKTDGATWVSKYARGGSARKLSARKFYIVVDAVQGHLASNGFAPYPRQKMTKLLGNIEETKILMANGQ